jgi:hypothetical protein
MAHWVMLLTQAFRTYRIGNDLSHWINTVATIVGNPGFLCTFYWSCKLRQRFPFFWTNESLANRCEPPYGSEGSLVPVRCIQKNLFWNLLGLIWWSQLFSVLRSYLGHSPVHGFTDSSRKLKSFILGRTHKSDVL